MECQTCAKPLGPHTPTLCPTCILSRLYDARVELAHALIERAKLSAHVEAVVQPVKATAGQSIALSGALIDVGEAHKKMEIERVRAGIAAGRERVRVAEERVAVVRAEIAEVDERVEVLRRAVAGKKGVLGVARGKLEEWRGQVDASSKKFAQRAERETERLLRETVNGRIDLCLEAADIVGLKRVVGQRRRASGMAARKDDGSEMVYVIGCVGIVDLRHMNGRFGYSFLRLETAR